MLRIGVYSIALNESTFTERWVASARDADFIFVADTGSTDDTVAKLERNNVKTTNILVKPFRFDDARNAALNSMPSDLDIVISLDMDEVLVPGWRKKIEQTWTGSCNRLRYKYIWSWYHSNPDVVYYGDKITGRFTHRWKHAVHEILSPTVPEKIEFFNEVLIEHHPDSNKSRGQYLGLLEKAVLEDPADDRNAYYLGREYYFNKRYCDSVQQLTKHLALPRATWAAERAASMRYIAKSHEELGDIQKADYWYTMAVYEDLHSKEALIDAGKFCLSKNYFHRAIDFCERSLSLKTESGVHYLNERYALNEGPYDVASVAHFYLGNKKTAIRYAHQAILLNPHDARLKNNLAMMQKSIGEKTDNSFSDVLAIC